MKSEKELVQISTDFAISLTEKAEKVFTENGSTDEIAKSITIGLAMALASWVVEK